MRQYFWKVRPIRKTQHDYIICASGSKMSITCDSLNIFEEYHSVVTVLIQLYSKLFHQKMPRRLPHKLTIAIHLLVSNVISLWPISRCFERPKNIMAFLMNSLLLILSSLNSRIPQIYSTIMQQILSKCILVTSLKLSRVHIPSLNFELHLLDSDKFCCFYFISCISLGLC